MSKESNFLIYCMERYRHFKGLSRADVTKTFEKYGGSVNMHPDVVSYFMIHHDWKFDFESLHTMGDHCIVQDIDDYISSITGNGLGKA